MKAQSKKTYAPSLQILTDVTERSKDVFGIAGRVLSETAVKQRLEATRKWPIFSVCP